MNLRVLFLAILLSTIVSAPLPAQKRLQPTRKQVYKRVGDVELKMHVFLPAGHKPSDRRAAIVFFFGGGWNGGNPSQFYPHCAHLAKKGVLAMAAEYRVKSRHKTTPFECVMDGKSAVRWIRNHASELGVDPKRVAAGGGSAGGHVAAATATVPGLNQKGEDTTTSCLPAALVLFNPVFDNSKEGYGFARVKERYREISPMHNIRKGMPPAIVFLGTKDKLIPVATAKKFQDAMKKVGSRSELKLYQGAGHGFFNFGRQGNKHYLDTVKAMDAFLASQGWFK